VEHARTVVQVATSGKSAIIDPSGRTLAESGPLFTADTLLTRVPLSQRTTLATRTGAGAEWLLVAVCVLGMLIGGRVSRLRRRLPVSDDRSENGQPVEQPAELTGKGRG
jgi:apolipoprotein N-acyltransferase